MYEQTDNTISRVAFAIENICSQTEDRFDGHVSTIQLALHTDRHVVGVVLLNFKHLL